MSVSGLVSRLRMSTAIAVLLLSSPLASLQSCGARSQDALDAQVVHLALSAELEPIAQRLPKCWPVTTEVRLVSSGDALERLRIGYVNAVLLWGPAPDVAENITAEALASDALAIVVHPRNRVGSLTRDDLRSIFSGEVRDWAAYGQEVGSIQVVTSQAGTGSREALSRLIMEGEAIASDALVATSTDAVLDYVAAEPGAIGYVPASLLREGVRALTVEGERPEPQKVRDGSYPLMVGIWLVYRVSDLAEEVVSYIGSGEMRELLAKVYASPQFAA